ncbi:MAG: putative lipoprotein [bacterium P3]|nr:MAG: putative lipoprotein [bacterium P3]KWW42347.1 MAG: putative lipoprotein [bacterium F083]
MKKYSACIAISAICIFSVACNGVGKVLKSNDFEKKYEAAMEYYNSNRYTKAIQVFENLTLYYRGQEHAEDILWYYGQSLLKEKDFFSAAYQFKRYAKQYPYSSRAEEAAFLSAYCQYQESPSYTLDQTTTKMAISDFERFVERYPHSNHVPEINAYLDEMRDKLMRKDYEIAYGYYRIESYHAAYVSLQNFLNLYPDSPYREDAMFYLLRSGYEYAINSTETKRPERLKQVINDFEKLSGTFRDSRYMDEARQIYNKTREAMRADQSL